MSTGLISIGLGILSNLGYDILKFFRKYLGNIFNFFLDHLWILVFPFLSLQGYIGWTIISKFGAPAQVIYLLFNIIILITAGVLSVILSESIYVHKLEVQEKPNRNYKIYKTQASYIYKNHNDIDLTFMYWVQVIQGEVKEFVHTFLWASGTLGKPDVYMLDKEGKRTSPNPIDKSKVTVSEIPGSMGWADLTIVLPTLYRKIEDPNSFAIELKWFFKHQAKKAEPALQFLADKHVYNLPKAIFNLVVEIPEDVIELDEDKKAKYNWFIKLKRESHRAGEKEEFKKVGKTYKAELTIGGDGKKNLKLQHRLVYGLNWSIKNRKGRVLNKTQNEVDKMLQNY